MKLYDSLIEELPSLISAKENYAYSYEETKCWPESRDYELIFHKDMAYELGGRGCDSVNCTLVTDGRNLVSTDEILVYGEELEKIKQDVSYARIAVVRVREDFEQDSEKIYQMLSDIDFVKYHIFPQGFMFRNSGQSNREQVRVGRKELAEGMSFERIGNTIIRRFKENPEVEAVRLIFITTGQADFHRLGEIAEKSTQIRRSLSMINKNLPTECSVCGIRDICNEVEGLKELHFGKKSTKNEQKIIL